MSSIEPGAPVGVIGTGRMGHHLAANLLKAGYGLTVHDSRKESAGELIESGARWVDSPREVAAASALTITVLPGPPEVEDAVLGDQGVLQGAGEGDFYIDMTTSLPSTIRKIASVAETKGVHVLDAPMSGGVRGARLGTLVLMVGGDPAAFEECEPVLRVLGETIVHVGDVGAGSTAKLVNNMMGMSNTLAAMEAMVIGAKAGVDPRKLLEVAEAGTGASFMLSNTFNYIVLPGKFEPTRFAMSLAAKDFRLALDYADEIGVPVKVVRCVSEALHSALEQGMGERDLSAYITLLEEAAGVEVRD